MSFGRIKIRKADTLFRNFLLKTKGEKCEFCGKIGRVEVSHFWGRRHEAVRFSEKNCDLICNFHHRYFHENPSIYHDWKLKKLGKKEFAKLKLAAHLYCKRDDKVNEIYWQAKLLEVK